MKIRVYKVPFAVPGVFSSLIPFNYNGVNLYFDQFADNNEGGIFRHTTLSRKFIADRRIIPLTSSEIPPQFKCIRRDDYSAGGFYTSDYIGLIQSAGDACGISHEIWPLLS